VLEPARIDAARAVAEHRPDAAGQDTAELVVLQRGELPDRLDARGEKSLFGLWAHAG
jgi:hypothetical protein